MVARIASSSGLATVRAEKDAPPIVTTDRFGTVAVAKLELRPPTSVIYDYMSLLKIDGEWRIVNKIFDIERISEE